MKKQETIKDLFGLSQIEMAMLLGVSRGQWSMFESGKRSLPTAANLLLADMLAHMQSAEAKTATDLPKSSHAQSKQQLEALLKENEYQLLMVVQKIAALEKKQEANAKALEISSYLTSRSKYDRTYTADLVKSIASRATKSVEKNELELAACYTTEAQLLLKQSGLQKSLKCSE